MARGGDQVIPRPPSARPGGPPPWVDLPAPLRRISLATVRTACTTLPTPSDGPGIPAGARAAAVLVALFEEAGEARVILTKRPATMPSHRGEIAFPGGKHDPGLDADLLATALREAREEIGLEPAVVEPVGELDRISTVSAPFAVTPFVGLLPARPRLEPHPWEVDAVLDVALSELLHDDVFREERWDFDGRPDLGPGRSVHFYELVGETVWGATARILTDLLAHVTSVVSQPDPDAHPGIS